MGGVGALLALFFLARNLRVMRDQQKTNLNMLQEMQSQRKTEYREYIKVCCKDLDIIDEGLKVIFHFKEPSSSFIFLRRMLWLYSPYVDINEEQWYSREKTVEYLDHFGPIYTVEEGFVIVNIPPKVKLQFMGINPNEGALGTRKEFYLHSIFEYVDKINRVNWVYICWLVQLKVEFFEGKKIVKSYFTIKKYRVLQGE